MKKIFTSSSLGLALKTFSFFPLKGPYDFSFHYKQNHLSSEFTDQDLDLDLVNLPQIGHKKIKNYYLFDQQGLFLANFQMHFTTALEANINMNKNHPSCIKSRKNLLSYINSKIDLLNCKFSYDPTFWEQKNNQLALKENFYDSRAGMLETVESVKINDFDKSIQIPLFSGKSFTSISGVEVDNLVTEKIIDGEKKIEKEVVLSKNGKTVRLDTALKKYFESINDVNTSLAHTWESTGNPSFTSQGRSAKGLEPVLHMLNISPLNLKDLNCLRKSKILALWRFIPQEVDLEKAYHTKENKGKRKVERKMWGLAEDKNGKLFHWWTDLGRDISVLMQYACPIDKKNPVKH